MNRRLKQSTYKVHLAGKRHSLQTYVTHSVIAGANTCQITLLDHEEGYMSWNLGRYTEGCGLS